MGAGHDIALVTGLGIVFPSTAGAQGLSPPVGAATIGPMVVLAMVALALLGVALVAEPPMRRRSAGDDPDAERDEGIGREPTPRDREPAGTSETARATDRRDARRARADRAGARPPRGRGDHRQPEVPAAAERAERRARVAERRRRRWLL